MRHGMILLSMFLVSCDAWDDLFNPNLEADADTDTDTDSDTDTDTDADSDTDTDTDADADADIVPIRDETPPPAGTWRVRPHPCVGSRTDTMLLENGGATIWIGCGTTVDGRGLFRSTDRGNLWEEVAPSDLGSWRINDLQRADDGNLYIAGIDTNGSGRGAMLSPSDQVTELLQNEGQLWNAMITGSVRRTPAGDIAFESLNGTDVAYGPAGSSSFYDAYGWWTNGIGKQILDLEIVGEDFYGVGSTIASPPVVFLPPSEPRVGFQMLQVELSDEFEGELWDLHIDGEGLLAAGVNQDENHGVVFVSGGNPYVPANWLLFEADILFSTTTWFRGVCRADGRIIAVGEYSSTEDGLVVGSDDDGLSWYPIALPEDTGSIQVCRGMPDGTWHFAGADGFYAIYTF